MKKIGIDLGTTNTVVSIKEDDEIKIIEVDNGILIPSVFYYNRTRNIRLVGKRAKNRGAVDPRNYIKATKRYIDSPEAQFTASGESFTAEDIAVEILLKVKAAVYDYLGKEEELEAVITVPNNFSTTAVENTKNAGRRAGFQNVTTLKEPIASVLAYGEDILPEQKAIYFVCDFGGGTLDIAVIRYDGQEYEVIATGGNEKLGGEDFTSAMMEYCYDLILEQHKVDLSQDKIDGNVALESLYSNNEIFQRVKARLAEKAEAAKIALSVENKTTIELTELYIRNGKPVVFCQDITAEEFNTYPKTKRLLRNFEEAIQEVLSKMAHQGIELSDIDYVILVGGSMNLPQAKAIVKKRLPVRILDDHLDTIVAIGASGKIDIQKRIIPRLNYNLGVKIKGGGLSVLISEQSQYPITKKSDYTTSEDNQTEMIFEVYEGNVIDNVYDSRNHWLGRLRLSDIEARPQGEAHIELTFSLNAEGILKITALDTSNQHQVQTELNWGELKK